MSVLMTLRVKADPAKLEEFAGQNEDTLRAITDRAKAKGALSHRFYGSDDGTVLVVDEWESPEGFQAFFEADPDIPSVMQSAGASGEPEVTFWRKLDTHDEF